MTALRKDGNTPVDDETMDESLYVEEMPADSRWMEQVRLDDEAWLKQHRAEQPAGQGGAAEAPADRPANGEPAGRNAQTTEAPSSEDLAWKEELERDFSAWIPGDGSTAKTEDATEEKEKTEAGSAKNRDNGKSGSSRKRKKKSSENLKNGNLKNDSQQGGSQKNDSQKEGSQKEGSQKDDSRKDDSRKENVQQSPDGTTDTENAVHVNASQDLDSWEDIPEDVETAGAMPRPHISGPAVILDLLVIIPALLTVFATAQTWHFTADTGSVSAPGFSLPGISVSFFCGILMVLCGLILLLFLRMGKTESMMLVRVLIGLAVAAMAGAAVFVCYEYAEADAVHLGTDPYVVFILNIFCFMFSEILFHRVISDLHAAWGD